MRPQIHARNADCPEWCHLCPFMSGRVMPHCLGTINSTVESGEDYDITACCCTPHDPMLDHMDLVSSLHSMRELLRDLRRYRRSARQAVDRLSELSRVMRTAGADGQAVAWKEVEGIAMRLRYDAYEQIKGRPHPDSEAVEKKATERPASVFAFTGRPKNGDGAA